MIFATPPQDATLPTPHRQRRHRHLLRHTARVGSVTYAIPLEEATSATPHRWKRQRQLHHTAGGGSVTPLEVTTLIRHTARGRNVTYATALEEATSAAPHSWGRQRHLIRHTARRHIVTYATPPEEAASPRPHRWRRQRHLIRHTARGDTVTFAPYLEEATLSIVPTARGSPSLIRNFDEPRAVDGLLRHVLDCQYVAPCYSHGAERIVASQTADVHEWLVLKIAKHSSQSALILSSAGSATFIYALFSLSCHQSVFLLQFNA